MMLSHAYVIDNTRVVPADPDPLDPRGLLWMWEEPKRASHFVLGVDPTNAIHTPGWNRTLRTKGDWRTDNSAIEVFRVGGVEADHQVAEWAGPLDAESLASLVNIIGRMYGEHHEDGQALTCIEVYPGNGWMTQRELINRFHYFNFPPWLVESGMTQRVTSRFGWYSSTASRRELWTRGANHLAKHKAVLHSPWLVEEMVDCTPDNFLSVTARSLGGRHDDRVVATLIALWTANEWSLHVDPTEPIAADTKIVDPQASDMSLARLTEVWDEQFTSLLGDE